MRKRSRYRPKERIKDPLNWVINGMKPVAAAGSEMTLLGIKTHGAIEAVRTGQATRDQVGFLVSALNISLALAYMGQGGDWIDEIAAARTALKAASERPKFLFTGAELQAVNLAVAVHDAQMADPKTTVQLLERAISGLKRVAATGRTTVINVPN